MIHGIGVDIVCVARIRRILAKYPQRFPQRILHPQEYKDYSRRKDKAAFLARRFAAKEAVSKALGLGFTEGLSPRSLSIQHDRRGRPYATWTTPSGQNTKQTIMVSVSDEADYAIAQAIVIEETVK